MANDCYGWKRYSHQSTITFNVGANMGGVAITALPTGALKAGRCVANGSTGAVAAKDVYPTSGGSAPSPGKDFIVAEDYAAGDSKLVCFALTDADVDNLVVRSF